MTFADWGQLFLYLFAAFLLKTLVIKIYLAVKRYTDRVIPDNMEMGAGQWLRDTIAKRGLDVRVFVDVSNESDIDAFFPSSRIIRMSREVYFKKDPSFWAVAAHELGHALVRKKSRLLAALFSFCRFGGDTVLGIGSALILANILYGIPSVNAFAFDVVIFGTALYVGTLVDEAAASIIGLRLLQEDGRVDARGMWASRWRLAAAYLTYLGTFAGLIVLLFERRWITRMVEEHRHFTPAAHLEHVWLPAIIATLLVAAAVWHGLRILRRPTLTDLDKIQKEKTRAFVPWAVCDVVALFLLWRVWDQPLGTSFAIACVLALFASRLGVAIVTLPVTLVLGIVVTVIVMLVIAIGEKIWKSERQQQAALPSVGEMDEAAKLVEEMLVDSYNNPEWHATASKLANVALQLGFAGIVLFRLFA